MSILLIDEDGVRVNRSGERFLVTDKGIDLLTVRATDVTTIILVGRVEISSSAIDLALSRNVPVFFETTLGKLRGTLNPLQSHGAQLREDQYAMFNDNKHSLSFAKSCVAAQLNNQRAILRHLALRRNDIEAIEDVRQQIKELRKSISCRNDIKAVRGIEGTATRLTLHAIRGLLTSQVGFGSRVARSGKDPFNVTLDVCGGLLAAVCRSAIEAARLDPYKGVLHGTSRNAPALALDLEDIYRPQMVIAVCVGLFTKKVLDDDDFIKDKKSFRLSKIGINKVCRQFGRKLQRKVTRDDALMAKSYIQQIHDDADVIAQWIKSKCNNELRFFEVR